MRRRGLTTTLVTAIALVVLALPAQGSAAVPANVADDARQKAVASGGKNWTIRKSWRSARFDFGRVVTRRVARNGTIATIVAIEKRVCDFVPFGSQTCQDLIPSRRTLRAFQTAARKGRCAAIFIQWLPPKPVEVGNVRGDSCRDYY